MILQSDECTAAIPAPPCGAVHAGTAEGTTTFKSSAIVRAKAVDLWTPPSLPHKPSSPGTYNHSADGINCQPRPAIKPLGWPSRCSDEHSEEQEAYQRDPDGHCDDQRSRLHPASIPLCDIATKALDIPIPLSPGAFGPHQHQASLDARVVGAKRLGYVPAFPAGGIDAIDLQALTIR